MTVSWQKLLKWFIQACAVLILTVVGFEVAARFVMPNDIPYWRSIYFGDQRYGFYSKGALQNKTGYFNFRPNSKIDDLAYYPDANGKLTLEYHCTYQSDKLGFLSNERDYKDTNILLLGDSFAEGQGGCAWIPRLDPAIRSQIYSASVMGYGVLHWANVVADLEKIKKLQKILIIFITDDFFRKVWVFKRAQIECINERGDCARSYWWPITDDVKKVAEKRQAERRRPTGVLRFVEYHMIATYSLYKIMTGPQPDQQFVFKQSLDVIKRLATKYDVKLLWVNERDDNNRTDARATAIKDGLKGIRIERCNLPSTGFLPRDPHPSAAGYDVLKACVERVVRSW
jgi:hypothetical protein